MSLLHFISFLFSHLNFQCLKVEQTAIDLLNTFVLSPLVMFFFFGIFLFRNRILFGFDYVEVTHSKFYRIFF